MTRVLLDTHAFLWAINDDPRLSKTAARVFLDATGFELLLSFASAWEMAIKASLGKLLVPRPLLGFLQEQLRLNDVNLLTPTLSHAATVAELPFHHRDPFDRLIVAQAHCESLAVVSIDGVFDAYGVERIW